MATKGGRGGGASLSDLFDDDSSGSPRAVGEAARELADAFSGITPEIAKNLADLDDAIRDTDKAFSEAAKFGEASSKDLTGAMERIAEAQRNYAETVEKLTQNQVPTVKEAKKIAQEFGKLRKTLEKERRAMVGAGLVSGGGILNRASSTLRTTEGRQAFLRKRFGLGDDNILMAGSRRGVLGRGLMAAGGGIAAHGGGMAAALGRGGPYGIIAGVIVAGITAVLKRQMEGVKATVPTFANFGTGGAEGFNQSRSQMERILTSARDAARDWGGDAEAAAATVVKISQETGKANELVDGAIAERVEKLRALGVGTTEELGDMLIQRVRVTGQSLDQAMSELETVARAARTIAGDDTQGLVATMHDFYRAIDEVRQGSDAMHTSVLGLTKGMKLSMATAKQLGMTQDRAMKAAKGLTNALVNTYDEGFATINIQADLDAAMQSQDENIRKDAAYITSLLASGAIDQVTAARMFKSSGGRSDENVILQTLDRTMTESGMNPHIMATALGMQEITTDQFKLLEAFNEARQKTAGGSMTDVLAQMSDKDREGFDAFMNEARKQLKLDPSKQMDKILDRLSLALSEAIPNALTTLANVLDSMVKMIEEVRREGFFGFMGGAVKGAVGAPTPTAMLEDQATLTLKAKVDRLTGGSTKALSLPDSLMALEASQQVDLGKRLSMQEASVVNKLAVPTKGTILDAAFGADGKLTGKMLIDFGEGGAGMMQSAMEVTMERADRLSRVR